MRNELDSISAFLLTSSNINANKSLSALNNPEKINYYQNISRNKLSGPTLSDFASTFVVAGFLPKVVRFPGYIGFSTSSKSISRLFTSPNILSKLLFSSF